MKFKIDKGTTHDHNAHPIVVEVRHLPKSKREEWHVKAYSFQLDESLKAERGSIDAFGTDEENIYFSSQQPRRH